MSHLTSNLKYTKPGEGCCFNRFDGVFFDTVPVAFAFPYCLNRKYAGSDPAYDSCIVYS